MPDLAPRLTGLPPALDAEVETLILGSFPGPMSLTVQQYYGNPQNHFWRLLGAVIGEPLSELPYAERLRHVLAHRVGLWDVFDACQREGALDSAIRSAQANDFTRLRQLAPRIGLVAFNGKTAGRYAADFASAGYDTLVLPSSSPAYTLPFEKKLAAWRQIVDRRRK